MLSRACTEMVCGKEMDVDLAEDEFDDENEDEVENED